MFRANLRRCLLLAFLALLGACGDDPIDPGNDPANISMVDGSGQDAPVGTALPDPLRVLVTDADGAPLADITVTWVVVSGGGSIPSTSVTGQDGVATAVFTLGPATGEQSARAELSGVSGSPVTFTATATDDSPQLAFTYLGGGNNVPERYTSDLWVHGGYAYTGTWYTRTAGNPGNALKVWQLSATGAPGLVNTVTLANVGTVSDVEVTADGQLLLATAEAGGGGLYLYSLANPAAPALLGSSPVASGLHTGTFATIAGRRYVFAARNPTGGGTPPPALMIFDVTDPGAITVAATVPVPATYGIHDTFVRDGIAFVFAWNAGVIIYDVGNGMNGGVPGTPVEISRLITATSGVAGGAQVHNGWWFHNPVTSERRYLFIGQEGPSSIGTASSGDIHVVDVSNLAAPVEVASYRMEGAGTHNFWMDEQKQILFAAYYNGGVVALDVSGTLSGNLAGREIARIRPGGVNNTFVWGVQLYNGSLYASDMLSGLWQLGMSGF